ncbi:hypothetical protein DM826_10800 [Halonotius aquaticus]|jgi:hypothetical protein|uniref:DUF8006 domain-containing protein n=2 Tax=Halonotius TaxID=869896 RepID=A0A3A6PL04_9EURY|nr:MULTISPECIES: hypothetical protein [Halonotius]RJX42129.1 hypothetical protein DM826_10800 [Halonotius aquaticus]RJX50420.1 hypothetical protein DP106_05865 [Halonotius pteroides]
MLPLFIDAILVDYNIGQFLLLGFVLTTLGALPLKSQQVIGINTMLFGVIFVLTPASLLPNVYLFLGLTLLVIGPMVYVTARG